MTTLGPLVEEEEIEKEEKEEKEEEEEEEERSDRSCQGGRSQLKLLCKETRM